jgi:predicted alpha/beta-hydrolase family hydrolase
MARGTDFRLNSVPMMTRLTSVVGQMGSNTMKKMMAAAFAVVVFGTATGWGQTSTTDWRGREFQLPWRGKQIPIYVPTNYDPAKPSPVFLLYPGTSGVPSTGLISQASGGKDFIVVGMRYVQDGMFTGSQSQALKELLNGAYVVRQLKQMKFNVDSKRLYVGGTSKGGWISSLIAEAKMNELAGVMILAGGVVPESRRRAQRKKIKPPKPLYIGVGEFDPNCIASRAAIRHFSALGAKVTYDEYLNVGHQVKVTQSMKDWLAIEARRGAGDVQSFVDERLKSMMEQAKKQWTGIDLYLGVHAMRRGPWYQAASDPVKKAVDSLWLTIRRDRSLVQELKAASAYNGLVAKEIAARRNPTVADRVGLRTKSKLGRSVPDLNRTISLYQDINRRYPGTHFGQKSLGEVKRLQEHIRYVQSR